MVFMFVKGISFAIQFPEVFTAALALCLEGTLHVDELQQILKRMERLERVPREGAVGEN